MKKDILKKLRLAEKILKEVSLLAEHSEDIEEIIIHTSRVKKILERVKYTLLKNHLISVVGRSGISQAEVLKYYELLH